MQGYLGVEINPRPYQREALRSLWRTWHTINPETGKEYQRLLIVLPTGTGKTMIFSMLANHVVKNEGKKVLILAHRDELIRQAADKLMQATGLDCAIEKAQETGHDTFYKVVVGSIQTLCSEQRLKRYRPDHFDYIIVDETHRILAVTYQRILKYFSTAKVLGVTATAMRGDKQSLGKFFEKIAYEYRLKNAINDGWLTSIVAETCPVQVDMRQVRVTAGDFSAADVEEAIRPHLEAIADQIVLKASNRKILLFLPLVATAKLMAEILCEKGITCRSVDGAMNMDDRRDNLDWFKYSPRGTALTNSMLLTEGFDQADIDCVIVLRPTKSRGLYCQMIGRGTRVLSPEINEPHLSDEQRRSIIAASEKKDLLILDPLWLTAQHRLCTPATLVAATEEAETYIREHQKVGGRLTLDEIEATSDRIADGVEREKREQALASQLEALKGKAAVRANPVLQALSIFDGSITNWEPANGSQMQPATQSQIATLEACGFKDAADWSSGFAAKILNTVADRRKKDLASPKQLKMLVKYGIPNADKVTFAGASAIIDKFSKTWKNKGRR